MAVVYFHHAVVKDVSVSLFQMSVVTKASKDKLELDIRKSLPLGGFFLSIYIDNPMVEHAKHPEFMGDGCMVFHHLGRDE